MRFPSWNEFAGKYPDDPRNAFQALCRLLFRKRFGIGDALPYFYNHPGIETAPITMGTELIGFQSKYFTGETIDDSQAEEMIASINTAKRYNPNLTKIILFTNSVFYFPKPNENATKRQKKVEKAVTDQGMSFEWMFGDNILDLVAKTPLANDLFFDLGSNISHLPKSVRKHNDRCFKDIDAVIPFREKVIKIDRQHYVKHISELLEQRNNVIIRGDSGTGKSAIVKQYWEGIEETETSFFFLNGYQFGTNSVNDLFCLDEDFTFSAFRKFFSDVDKKIVFIDSAEKILEQSNRLVFQVFLNELMEIGWQFVFTCKNTAADDLQTLLKHYSVSVSGIDIEQLSEEELSQIERDYQIPVPNNEKIRKQIRNLFYLARYCEMDNYSMDSSSAFRNMVWNRKVRGVAAGPDQQKREECLLKIVRAQQENGVYQVSLPDLDHSAAFALETEEILVNNGYRGYSLKHDIYIDWALDYIIERDFDSSEHCKSILSLSKSVSYTNAFKRWLLSVIDSGDPRIESIVNAFLSGIIHEKWEAPIISCIGLSKEYASFFFVTYDKILKADQYKLFNLVIDVLYVSCQEIVSYLEYKGDKYPMMRPIGAGWDEAIRFLFENRDEYYMAHADAVYKLLNAYSKIGSKAKERRKAALLALFIFDKIAEARKAQKHFWLEDAKRWCVLVCTYAVPIRNELDDRFQQVVDNRWLKHNAPYAELIAFVLRDSENVTAIYPVCVACTKRIIELMDLFWPEHPETEVDHSWPYRSSQENDYSEYYWFGLNKEFDNGLSYFPASGFQTPITPLLVAEHKYYAEKLPVMEFLVRFVDERIDYFTKRKRDFHESIEELNIKVADEKAHRVLANQGLWNLYRGTSNMNTPHLIESIHMALEIFLLDLIKDPNKDILEGNYRYVHMILGFILKNTHSASLYSIVASLAMADPYVFFEELLVVCQDIRFLSYDLTRYTCEQTAGFLMGGMLCHQQMNDERQKSNEQPHRRTHLEQTLLKCQIQYTSGNDEASQTRLNRLFALVDKLYAQVNGMKEVPSVYRFILARLDYRTMKKEEVKLKNGMEAIQLTPNLSEDLKAESDALINNVEWMRGINLNVWTEKAFEGNRKALQGLNYGNDIQQVLIDIRIVENRYKTEPHNTFALDGDKFVPYKASAVLLLRELDRLNGEEKKECYERVMSALQAPGFLIGTSMTGINICLSVIPRMMELYPERVGDFSEIIATFIGVKEEYLNSRICDIMSNVIETGELWNHFPEVMDGALERIKGEIFDGDFQKMSVLQANSVLCLLTPKTPKRALGETCVLIISKLWEPKSHHRVLERTYHDSNLIAKYILNAPITEVGKLIAPYANLLDAEQDHETLLSAILIYAVNNDKYDSFWIIWNSFYEPLKKTIRFHHNGQLMNTYLLNPPHLTPVRPDWFRLEEKDIDFFRKVSREIPRHPAVLNSIAKVFSTIGKSFTKQGLCIISELVNTMGSEYKIETTKDSVIMNLESIINHTYVEHEDELRTNAAFRKQLLDVLSFMIHNGSQAAAFMQEKM